MTTPPQIDSAIAAQKEILAFSYNSAAAYTNVILGAGYVGYFATWTFIHDRLTPSTELWTALLVLISLLSFICFEVYKSFYISQSLQSLHRVVSDPTHFIRRANEYNKTMQALTIQMFSVWRWAFWITLSTGIAGAGVLISAVVHGLFLHYAAS
ncbi:MAG TPA: hypothetical protein VGO61_07810 [Steroidobacteraceae bacterium]|jgi:hypothetical protein|nr:hypothetical protein [Steroidobacteraceae bacterium]